MRVLIAAIVIAAAGWSGYWWIGASTVENGMTDWFSERQLEGWVAEYDSLETHGFPNRFDTTLKGVMLADPDTGLAWKAPFFQILALSYQPGHIIAAWAPEQTIQTPFETVTVSNEVMRGSVVFAPTKAFALQRMNTEIADLRLSSDRGWSAAINNGQFAIRATAARENAYDLYVEGLGVKPASDVLNKIDPLKKLPDAFETLRADITIGFDAPWDRHAIEDARPQPTSVDFKTVQATWGDLDLRFAGHLDVDVAGVPEGEVTVKAKNWRDMIALAVDSNMIGEDLARTIENGLSLVAGMSGNSQTLDVPVTFKNGGMFLGFVPLGPTPTLRLR
ncbi:MAG: DUF2125 domain-containing protein [Pseudoruegeria sp.]